MCALRILNLSRKYLISSSVLAVGGVQNIATDGEALALPVLGSKRQRARAAIEGEQLAVSHLAAAVCTATTREHDDCVAGGATGVEVEARLSQRADDQGRAGLVVVETLRLYDSGVNEGNTSVVDEGDEQ